MSPDLPEMTPRIARGNFLDLADAMGGLTPADEKYLKSRPQLWTELS